MLKQQITPKWAIGLEDHTRLQGRMKLAWYTRKALATRLGPCGTNTIGQWPRA